MCVLVYASVILNYRTEQCLHAIHLPSWLVEDIFYHCLSLDWLVQHCLYRFFDLVSLAGRLLKELKRSFNRAQLGRASEFEHTLHCYTACSTFCCFDFKFSVFNLGTHFPEVPQKFAVLHLSLLTSIAVHLS